MNDLLPAARSRPSGQAVHLRYEKAGLVLYDAPVPWNADAAVVEVILRLPPAARQKTDYLFRVPGREPIPPESLRRDDADDRRYRLLFRFPVPLGSTPTELLWKHHLLATVPVPVLSPGEFLANLRLATPTLSVRVGGQSVAARTFVAAQCKGLTAAAVLGSPTSLAPLADLGLRVVFRAERSGAEYAVPVPLTGAQLAAREALVTASPPKAPRRSGGYSAAWYVGERELGALAAQAVSGPRFVQSLRVSDARFLAADKLGPPRVCRHMPPPGDAARVGPCFVLHSREPGMAGLVTLRVHALRSGADSPAAVMEQPVLVTDGPTVFAPGLLDAADLAGLTGFELRHKQQVLGLLSLNPVPTAGFTSEGGFRPPPDFAWTPTADDELHERMMKLMRDDNSK
jgi:hypothetical protein